MITSTKQTNILHRSAPDSNIPNSATEIIIGYDLFGTLEFQSGCLYFLEISEELTKSVSTADEFLLSWKTTQTLDTFQLITTNCNI